MNNFMKNLSTILILAAMVAAPIVYIHSTFARASEVAELKTDMRSDIKEIRSDVKSILRRMPRSSEESSREETPSSDQ